MANKLSKVIIISLKYHKIPDHLGFLFFYFFELFSFNPMLFRILKFLSHYFDANYFYAIVSLLYFFNSFLFFSFFYSYSFNFLLLTISFIVLFFFWVLPFGSFILGLLL